MRNINMYLFKNVCAIALVAMLSACGAESAGTESEAGESSADEQSQTTETGEQGGSDDTASTDDTTGDESTDSTDDTTPSEPEVDPMAELVEGWYVYRLQVTTESDLPLIGPTESSIYNYGVAEIRKEGAGFVMVERHCRYAMSTSEYFTAEIDDAVPASIAPVSSSITFREEGNDLVWERAETVVVLGAELDDPRTDELPTTAEDERVIDQDNDGNPGVTAHVDGLITADVYFVQRQRMAYSGIRSAAGDLMGEIQDASEQNIIGATNSLLTNSADPTPVPEASSILFIPVQRELSCEQLNGSIETYFGE